MKIIVRGLQIPHTNEWHVDETWTVQDLIEDVVKIASAKKHDPDRYRAHLKDRLQPNTRLTDILSEGDVIHIKRKN